MIPLIKNNEVYNHFKTNRKKKKKGTKYVHQGSLNKDDKE